MDTVLADWLAQQKKEIEEKVKADAAAEIAKNNERFAKALLEERVSVKKVASLTGLDPATVKELKASLSA